ncbi:YdbH domain-containing protein [Thalassobaculum sp.]|uniref:intermembrane phospholipid transport protein YdbH family protein n=1 Tax=Thalassobaculum sp. TaxID=2022740 RepID=UPI0032F0902D
MHWLGRSVLILLAIVAVLAPAIWIGRDVVPPRVVRWAVNYAAGAEVIDDLAFRIDGLSTGHVELTDLRVNADAALTAERVRLAFDPRELLGGRLRTVTVVAPELRATVGPAGGVGLGSLDAVVAAFGSQPDGTPHAPADGPPALRQIEIRDATVRLAGAATGRLRLDGILAPAPTGLAATLAWRLDAATDGTVAPQPSVLPPGLAVAAEGRLALDLDAAATRVNLGIVDGRLRRGNLEVEGLGGTVVLALPTAGSPVLSAALTAVRVVAGGVALAAPSLRLRYDPDGMSATARLGTGSEPGVVAAATADAAGPDGRRPFQIELRADLERVDAILAAWTDRPPMAWRGTATAEIGGALSLDDPTPAAAWSDAVASGGVTVTLDDGELPSGYGRVRGTARLALALAAGRLSVETVEPLTVETEPASPPVDELLAWPVEITLGTVDTPFRLLLEEPFGAARLEVAGPAAALSEDGARGAVEGSAAFRLGPAGWELERLVRAAVQVAGVTRAGVVLRHLDAVVEDLTVGPTGPAGRFDMTVRASAPDRGMSGMTAAVSGRIEPGDGGVDVVLASPGLLSVDRLAPAAPLAPIEGLTARIAATRNPIATVPADGGPLVLRLPLDLPALALASAEPGRWRIDLAPMRVDVDATLAPEAAGRLRIRLANAAAGIAPAGVRLEGLAADLRMALAPNGARLERVGLRARKLADQARLARFVPLSLEGLVRGAATARNPDRLAFRVTLRGGDGAFVLDADGHHAPSTGRGEAALTLFPIRFVPGGLQPADLSPAAAAMFRSASGEISLAGRVRWPGEAVPPDDPLTLTLKDLGFTGSVGTVTGLGGSVALTQVDPPATPPGQELTATAVDIGIPIVAPRVRFRLEPERILRLESVEARFADGRVSAEDVAVPLDGGRAVPVVLTVEKVDAARLAEVIDLEGLSATGTLSGWLPLLWDPRSGLAVRQARLTAGTGGGQLRYRPKDGAPGLQDSGEQVSLLLEAIRNFEYESFEVEADGRPGEPFDVKLRLRGANPDLYDGYPIALNVTLEGALDQLFGNLRRSLGLTDVIRRRLEASSGG